MKAVVNQQAAVVNQQAAVANTGGLFDSSLVDRWTRFSAVNKRSASTYRACLRQMLAYFEANGIKSPVRSDLESWRDSLIAADKSASTIRLYLSVCKTFFKFLAFENIFPDIAAHLKSRVRVSSAYKKDALSARQGRELLNAVEGDDEQAARNRAVIALMLSTGVRCVEVSRARVGDLRFINGGCFLYICGKGRHDVGECVRIAPQVLRLIQAYQKIRGRVKANAPLFSSVSRRNFGEKISVQTISKMIKSHLRKINLDTPRLSAHSLRHSCACEMLLAGVELHSVRQVLRHRNLQTTLIYTNVLDRAKNFGEEKAAARFFGESGESSAA